MPAVSLAKDKDKPVVLEPATVWSLDYAEEKCRLARAFGEGADRHMIFFEQSGPSAYFGLTIAGPSFDSFRAGRKLMIQFGPTLKPKDSQPYLGTLGTAGPALIYASMDMHAPDDDDEATADDLPVELAHIDKEQAASVDYISFSQDGREVIAQTGNLEAPIKALTDCAHEFVSYWGLDLERHRTATRLPVWINQSRIVRRIAKTYPSKALRSGEQGVFQMRVIIDENGEVAECHLANATISESLQSDACKEMSRAKFEPALDAIGAPMQSFYVTTIAYAIGRRRN